MTFAWEPAPVVGGAYTDDTRPWSVQDCVNWIPVQIERPGGRSDSQLRCAPGASVFCIPGPVQPVRGLHDVEGKLFAVVGTGLFQITPTGVAIPRGTIPGVRRVSMTHNQITGGNELVIANGLSGYVYNTKTETLVQITDDGFPGFKVCDYVDSYIVGVEPQGRFWFTSDLAAATSYNTLDRTEAESQPDRIVGLIVSHREVFVLGERTGEFFRNTGAATGTFQRADGTEMEVGCASADSIAKLDNSVFWLGNDGSVYRLNGYQPVRISTRPLEQAISRCNMTDAFAFTYEDRGHKIYYLTFPDGMTWGFDVSTGEWARRQSFGLDRWRMNCVVRWNKQWIAGDFVNGKLYRLEWDMPWENGEVIERRRTTGVLHGNQNRLTVDAVELVFDTGREDVATGDLFPAQPAPPTVTGDAPSVATDVPYSFEYTTTPGGAPISRTVLRETTLPAGWAWNEATATLSCDDPHDVTAFVIKMRTYDTNGLYGDHEDTIVPLGLLLVTGTDVGAGVNFVKATTNGALTFTGISPGTGADISSGSPYYYDGKWVVAGNNTARLSTDGMTTWETISNNRSTHKLCAGPSGWLLADGLGPVSASDRTGKANPITSGFSSYAFAVQYPAGTVYHEHGEETYMCRFAGGFYWLDTREEGVLVKATDLSLSAQVIVYKYSNSTEAARFYDVEVDPTDPSIVYAVVNWGRISPRRQLRKSTDGGATWPTVLIDKATTDSDRPYQIQFGSDVLVVATQSASYTWTSADNFAASHATGIGGDTPGLGRQIVFAGNMFYLISSVNSFSPTLGNKCVSTQDGITFGTPVNLGITNPIGIAGGER